MFEHSVANMFFYFLNGSYTLDAALSLLLLIVGNSLGGLAVSGVRLLFSKE